jgi:superfamily I DNA/RNA helicase
MAHILPDALPQIMPPEVHRVFKALKNLPDDWYVWHHLAPWQPEAPDFLVLAPGTRALLVKVSCAASNQAVPAAQLLLVPDETRPVGQAETEVLDRFSAQLDGGADQALNSLVVFPNLTHRQVRYSCPDGDSGPSWAGRELLHGDTAPGWEEFLPKTAMDAIRFEKLRQAFSPEVVVPADMTVRLPVERRLGAGLTGYLLDYSQEAAVKADLDLELDGQEYSHDFRLNIINGVAGSGKTLILLYRLRLLYDLYPQKSFLVLTHNRPLIHDMRSRFTRLVGCEPASIEWQTFNGWCFHHWPKDQPWIEPLSLRRREQVIHAAWRQHLSQTNLSRRMLLSEIDWIKDQLPVTRAEYTVIDRRGRGFRLSADLRTRVFDAYEAYQQMLTDQHTCDWGDIPMALWQFEQEGKVAFPQYDVILVDEAQFFAPLWLAIVQKLLKPGNPHLFVVADPTQGFLGRGASWKSLGLQARGRSQQLKQSYRTTREILQFATLFYRTRLKGEEDEDILPPDLLNMPNGAVPEMIKLTSAQDEISRVANEVAAFVKGGYPRKHLLLLHANGKGAHSLRVAINSRLGRNAAMDPKDTYPGNYVRVTTLNAGAGLESPIVFLVGLRSLFEEEQSLRLSDEERETLVRDNTRKIYMAATRAGQRLVFTFVGEIPDVLLSSRAPKSHP